MAQADDAAAQTFEPLIACLDRQIAGDSGTACWA
jgi:hypothetical protein